MIGAEDAFQDVEFLLNHGDTNSVKLSLGSQIIRRSKRIAKGVYDFSIQGGAIGTVKLYDPVYLKGGVAVKNGTQPLILPPGAIVHRVLIDVITPFTSGGGATAALGTGVSNTDIKAATAFASYTGLIDGIPVNTAATSVKVPLTTAKPGVSPTLTIATAALTAGKCNVHIEYYLGD